MMQISDRGIVALIGHEGIVPGPYLDSVGVWTFGVGHTAAAGQPEPALMARGMPADLDAAIERALVLFRHDVTAYAAQVAAALRVPVSQNEFDALVSFHYNTGAIARAEITRALNRGDRSAAAAAFMNWIKPSTLLVRRRAEQTLFLTGEYHGGRLVVWGVTSTGKVVWTVKASLTNAEALSIMTRGDPAPAPAKPPVIAPAGANAALPAVLPDPAAPVPATPQGAHLAASDLNGFLAKLLIFLKGYLNGK